MKFVDNKVKATSFKESCIHTRQLVSMIDVDRSDLRFGFFKKHTKTCAICQVKLKEIDKSLLRLEFYIPKPVASLDLKNEYAVELDQLMKNLNLSSVALRKEQQNLAYAKAVQILRDIESVFLEKKFLYTALLIVGSFIAFNLWSK